MRHYGRFVAAIDINRCPKNMVNRLGVCPLWQQPDTGCEPYGCLHCWMQAHAANDTLCAAALIDFDEPQAYGGLSSAERRDAAVHAGAEILTRALGSFS